MITQADLSKEDHLASTHRAQEYANALNGLVFLLQRCSNKCDKKVLFLDMHHSPLAPFYHRMTKEMEPLLAEAKEWAEEMGFVGKYGWERCILAGDVKGKGKGEGIGEK